MPIDSDKLNAFMGKMIGEMGAAFNAVLIVIGDKLGLYKAMASAGPMTSAALAKKTGTHERSIREWLNSQAAGGIVTFDPATQTYTLPDEHAFALAVEDSPAFLPGFFQVVASAMKDEARIADALKTGQGLGWHQHDTCLFRGTERFFRPGYAANLVSSWIPALTGIEQKLKSGGTVADVGCGHGASTILMAKAFPNSQFFAFDYHDASISSAQLAAEEAGVADRITFAVASAKNFPANSNGGYDLVTFFDCLHDMGDPVSAAKHVRTTLSPGGSWMIVEPRAGDHVEENLNPVGRIFYAASTCICTPASLSQEVGLALGAQAGEKKLREVVTAGGFPNFRRAAETPFNLVLEARTS
jgi:2-polyprenyl-3-methyl-5-hydroxy-6-metoxy-1,4-benzoquinol methylase